MIEFQKLTLADALQVVGSMREEDRYALKAVVGNVSEEFFAMNRWQTEGPAWTMVRDGEPIAIFGLSMHADWAAVAWLVATPSMCGESWRKLIRHCRTVAGNVRGSSLHRVEAHVVSGWPEAERFAAHVGFEHEGTRKRAGRDGQDVMIFALKG